MFKVERIKEEDYWVFPIVFVNIVSGAAAIWSSVPMFRVPPLLIAIFGNWFVFRKISRSYSPARARIHLTSVIVFTLLGAWIFYVLTN